MTIFAEILKRRNVLLESVTTSSLGPRVRRNNDIRSHDARSIDRKVSARVNRSKLPGVKLSTTHFLIKQRSLHFLRHSSNPHYIQTCEGVVCRATAAPSAIPPPETRAALIDHIYDERKLVDSEAYWIITCICVHLRDTLARG